MGHPPGRGQILVCLSFGAWALGCLVLAGLIWADATARPADHVGAGILGEALLIGFMVFFLCSAIGVITGVVATRRVPDSRSAEAAFMLNVITLVGVPLGVVLMFLLL